MRRVKLIFVTIVLISGVAIGIRDFKDMLISNQGTNARIFDFISEEPDCTLMTGQEGIYTITSETMGADSNSSWVTVIDRDGTDGGHLTVKIDSCVVYEHTVYSGPQGGGVGAIADLESGDVFIEWDEDPGHGSSHYFSFSGEYVEQNPSYVQVTGTGTTNWIVYQVISDGTLIKTDDGYNEHEAIHMEMYPAAFIITLENVDDVNEDDCRAPGDEITYTICYNYPNEPNIGDINSVYIVDYLPNEVGYISTDPYGFHDCNLHTVTWIIGKVSPGDEGCFTLKVRVRCDEAGSKIRNYCEVRNEEVFINSAYEKASICANYLVVDDMEDYDDRDSIRPIWHDGYPSGSSGSNITTSTDPEVAFPPYEIGPIHGGAQAMAFSYDNDGSTFVPGHPGYPYDANYYSEAYVDTNGPNSLGFGTDWTLQSVEALSLWFHGIPDLRGSFTEDSDIYTIEADGWDIGGEADGFFYAYKAMNGPATITVRVDSIENTGPLAKAGVMIRETLNPESKNAAVVMTAGNGISFLYREATGITTESVGDANFVVPHWVRLTLGMFDEGNIKAEHAIDAGGSPGTWQRVGNTVFLQPLPSSVYIGLCVTGHSPRELCTAELYDVSFTGSVSGDWQSKDIGIWINDSEPMYVVLEDSDSNGILYYPDSNSPDGADANAIQICSWTEWITDLNDFSEQGVNLTDVQRMYIGFGNRDNHPAPGGSGIVYIDDIRLYPSICLEELRPAGDLTCDCVVDYRDVKIIADEWLYTGCPEADLYEDEYEFYKVNFKDFAILAESWLEERHWP